MKVRSTPLLAAAALVAAALLPVATPAAADAGPVDLGFSRLGRLLLDEAHGRLFLSPGPGGSGVRVTGLSGEPVTTLPATPDANGMALTPDGSSLWVAVPSRGLVQFDAATLAPVRTIPLPTGHCAGDVAVVGSRLAYGHSCNQYLGTGSYGGVGTVDTATGAVLGSVTDGPFYRPVVAAGPAGQVYAADAGLSNAHLSLYDVTGAAPRRIAAVADSCEHLRELSAAPDGAQVVTSCGYPYRHTTWSSNALQVLGSYATGAHPLAGAWSADGRVFAAGDDAAYGTDVSVFTVGATSPTWTRDFGSSAALLQPRGLALSADGSRAWAVTRGPTGGLQLRVLDAPPRDATRLTLAADPPTSSVGDGTQLGGWLSWGGGGIAGVALTVTRAATGGLPVLLPAVTTRGDGTYAFLDAPAEPGTYTYTVSWPGDAGRAGATATTVARVDPRGASLELQVTSASGVPGQVQGRLLLRYSDSTSAAGRLVHLTREVDGVRTGLADLTTDTYGTATFTDSPPAGSVRYTASVDAAGGHPAAGTSATITTALTPTTLSAKAPWTASAGSSVTVSGLLTSPGAVVPGAPVSVTRSGCPGDWTGSAVTTPNGSWSVTDPSPPVGTCTYRASYAGDARYAASTASAVTSVSLLATGLTVVAPATAEVGSPLAVRGVLTAGAAAVGGVQVQVVRTGCSTGGWSTSVVTGADGSWSTSDAAPPEGTCTYTASSAQTETHRAATASGTTRVDRRTPALTLSVVRGTGSAKKTAYVTAQLGVTLTNRTLTITAQPSGGEEVPLASRTVDSSGRLTATYTPRTTTTYRVRFAGDAWYAPRTVEQLQ